VRDVNAATITARAAEAAVVQQLSLLLLISAWITCTDVAVTNDVPVQ